VSVECTVVRSDRPPSADQILAIARRFMPEEVAQGLAASELGDRESTMIHCTARPDRWLAYDFSEDAQAASAHG
jgi:uncharacterized protein